MIPHFYNSIPGWCSNEQRKLYQSIINSLPNNSHIVEIGAWMGQSSSFMATEIANSNKSIKFDCVDHWLGSKEHRDYKEVKEGTLYDIFLKNIEPVADYINPIRQHSVTAAKSYPDASLDFIFIDGSHEFKDVADDIMAWLPKLKPGGILAGDDFSEIEFPGVFNAVHQTLNDIQVENTIWIYRAPKVDNEFQIITDPYINLLSSENTEIETYIIAIEHNKNSETQLQTAINSCKKVGQQYKVFYGYDGTDRKTIKTPDHLKSKDYMKWVKVKDHKLSITEVACALSHLAVWAECMTIDKPVLILEHDAVMGRAFKDFKFKNSIQYLGHKEQISKNIDPFLLPPRLQEPPVHHINYNFAFARGFHCYAIDPIMARRLFSQIMREGLINPIDVIAEITKYSVVQEGMYGYQNNLASVNSTIESPTGNNSRKLWTTIPGVSK